MLRIQKTMQKLPFLFVGLALAGCVNELNLDPSSDFYVRGNWQVPIIDAHFDLGNLVADEDIATADPDGLIHIIYREDSLYTQTVYDFTEIPPQAPENTTVTVGDPPVNLSTNLGVLGDAKLKSIGIETGKIFWQTNSPDSNPVTIQITLLNTTVAGAPAQFNITTTGVGVDTGHFNLANLEMDLTQGSPPYNNVGFSMEIINSGAAPNGTIIDVEVQYENLRVGSAVGYFGQREIALPSGNINTELSILNNISSGFYLANPLIKLIIQSNIGLPLGIAPNLVGIGKAGNPVGLDLDTVYFNGATSQGSIAYDTISISTANSNIDNFLAAVPEQLVYSGSVEMNPSGETGIDNFATSDGFASVGLEIDLPLEIKSENLTIENTLKDIDFGVDEGDVEFVEALELGFRVENAFPLQADLHLYFQDSTGVVLDSAQLNMFDAAQVDASGNVTNPFTGDRLLTFTNDELNNIMKCDDIRVKIILNTSGGGSQIVRLLTSNYINMKVGVRTKLNYKI